MRTWIEKLRCAGLHCFPTFPPIPVSAPATGRGLPTAKLALPPGVEYDSDLDGSDADERDDGEHEHRFVPHPDDIRFVKHSEVQVQDIMSTEGVQETKGVELNEVDVVGTSQENNVVGGDGGEGGGGGDAGGASAADKKRKVPVMERMLRVTPGWFFEPASISVSLTNNPRYSTYAGPEHAQATEVNPLYVPRFAAAAAAATPAPTIAPASPASCRRFPPSQPTPLAY